MVAVKAAAVPRVVVVVVVELDVTILALALVGFIVRFSERQHVAESANEGHAEGPVLERQLPPIAHGNKTNLSDNSFDSHLVSEPYIRDSREIFRGVPAIPHREIDPAMRAIKGKREFQLTYPQTPSYSPGREKVAESRGKEKNGSAEREIHLSRSPVCV
jgi:hypothetical protein